MPTSGTITSGITPYARSWDRIWGGSVGSIALLPTEALEAIVSYGNSWSVTCIIPGGKKLISTLFNRERLPIVIEHPPLALTQVLVDRNKTGYHDSWADRCRCFTCQTKRGVVFHHPFCLCAEKCLPQTRSTFYLRSLSDQKNLAGHPYVLDNCDTNGRFSESDVSPIKTLRKLNQSFWDSKFNDSQRQFAPFHKWCNARLHRSPCFDLTQTKKPNPHEAFGRCAKAPTCRCDCPNKETGPHLVTCHCYRSCSCRCGCACCTNQCDCICQCSCCRNTCSCSCSCNLKDEFIEKVKAYTETHQLKGLIDFHAAICDRHIRSQTHTDGFFFSRDTKFLKTLPKECLQYAPQYESSPFAIGLAKRTIEGDWSVLFRGSKDNDTFHTYLSNPLAKLII